MYLVIIGDVLVGEGKVRPNKLGSECHTASTCCQLAQPSSTSLPVAAWPCHCSLIAHQSSSVPCCHSTSRFVPTLCSQAEGLLSEDCGDRRTVLAVVTLLLLAPLVSAT